MFQESRLARRGPSIQKQRAVVSALTAIVVGFVSCSASAQQIYRWVDENGVVNFGETVPEGIEDFEAVAVAPAPTPTPVAPTSQPDSLQAEPAAPLPANIEPGRTARAPASAAATTPIPAQERSLEQLDQLCEDARERAIAPLREAAINECKAAPRADPAYCERFYATFGDATRTQSGAMRPRMFNDLPACVLAEAERQRRGGRQR